MTGFLGVLESTSLSSKRWIPEMPLAAGALLTSPTTLVLLLLMLGE